MASLTLNEGVETLDLDRFSAFVRRPPSYAVPVFLRIDEDIDVTGTFKMLKGDLRKQGYDIEQISGPVYVMKMVQPLTPPSTPTMRNGLKQQVPVSNEPAQSRSCY